MTLNQAIRIFITVSLVAGAGLLAMSREFYATSLTSPFFALALASVTIVHLRLSPSWRDVLALAMCTVVLALVDFEAVHFRPSAVAWFSFVGFSSLLILGIRAVWATGKNRTLFLYGFVPSLLFVSSEWFATTLLDWTEAAHPKTLDLYLYSFDASLRVQIPFLLGQAFAVWPWLRKACLLFYLGLPIPIAMVYAGQLLRQRKESVSAMAALLITGPIGVVFYNMYPALGPVHLFGARFPWDPLTTGQAARLFLEPVPLAGARNAIPSLHMAWVLLVWWYSRGLSAGERVIAMSFLAFTVLATLGTGEHYFVDLVVAYPFALFIQALCKMSLSWTDGRRLTAFLLGCLVTVGWLASLRYGLRVYWASPVIPWFLCVATIGFAIYLKDKMQSGAEVPAQTPEATPEAIASMSS